MTILFLEKGHICDGNGYLEVEEIQNTDKYKVRAHSNDDNFTIHWKFVLAPECSLLKHNVYNMSNGKT